MSLHSADARTAVKAVLLACRFMCLDCLIVQPSYQRPSNKPFSWFVYCIASCNASTARETASAFVFCTQSTSCGEAFLRPTACACGKQAKATCSRRL